MNGSGRTLSMTMSTASCRKSPDNCSQSLARLSACSGRRQKRSEGFSLTPILPTSGEPAHNPGFLQKPSFLLVMLGVRSGLQVGADDRQAVGRFGDRNLGALRQEL